MKILYFHQYFSTPAGSTGTRSYEMARALVQAGHEVTMVCGGSARSTSGLKVPFKKGRRTGMVEGIQVIELEIAYSNYLNFIQRSWIFFQFALRSIWIALREPYDLVFATSTPLTAGIPGIVARWLRQKRFVFEVRDLWPELPKAMGVITNPLIIGLMSALEWGSYRSAHACIGLSPGIVEGIRTRSSEGLHIDLIPNGCDFDLFSASDIAPKRPKNVNATDLLAVFAGAHGMANGLDAVLKAAEVLKKRNRDDIKLLFIGDGKLKPELHREAEKKELNNCLFLEPLPKQEIAAYLRGADIGLMILANIPAFYYGTSPNKFFDYLAAGLPVLNNYPGWITAMITEYSCGYAVEPNNPERFADTLEHAADHRDTLQDMGKRAWELGDERFDRKQLAAQFVGILEKTVGADSDTQGNQIK
ncbi:MAG: glycosyltransferase WbuB [Candidatus Electrothrix sp. AR5]|nr:glycosyltransferase WbuB [Candidatus Electrothrix sp. AR5]